MVVGAEAAEPVGVFGDTDESAVGGRGISVFFPVLGVGFGDVEAVASRKVGGVVVEGGVADVGGGFRPHRKTIIAHDDAGEDAVVIGRDRVGGAGEGEGTHGGHISQTSHPSVAAILVVGSHVAVESIASGVVETNVDVFTVDNHKVLPVQGGVGLTVIKS